MKEGTGGSGVGASSAAGGGGKAPADVGGAKSAVTGDDGGSSKGPAAIAAGAWKAKATKRRGKQYYISVILKPDVLYARRLAFGMGLHDRVKPYFVNPTSCTLNHKT